MDRYMQPSQPQIEQPQSRELADCRKRKPPVEDDSRRNITLKKMRLNNVKKNANINDSSNFTSSSLQQGHGSSRRTGSPRARFDHLTFNAHKNPLPILPPPQSKVVNWRLACFMAREYLSHGTLLGKPWPPHDSNTPARDKSSAKPKLLECEERGNEKEKEGLYTILSTVFLRSDDVHIPGILNPSQLAAWIGLR